MTNISHIWQMTIHVPDEHLDAFETLLTSFSDTISVFNQHNGWALEAIFQQEPDEKNLKNQIKSLASSLKIKTPKTHIRLLPDKDWLFYVHANFDPLTVGPFFIHEPGYNKDNIPPDTIPLEINAATAFGSGEHPTTEACLQSLIRLKQYRRFEKILDMGCGTGILSFAAAHLWEPTRPIIAIDRAEESIRLAKQNAKNNALDGQVTCIHDDGYRTPAVLENAPFDLIISNILAGPLIDMAPEVKKHLKKGGTAVLSGILCRQANSIIQAYQHQNFRLTGRVTIGQWMSLILEC